MFVDQVCGPVRIVSLKVVNQSGMLQQSGAFAARPVEQRRVVFQQPRQHRPHDNLQQRVSGQFSNRDMKGDIGFDETPGIAQLLALRLYQAPQRPG